MPTLRTRILTSVVGLASAFALAASELSAIATQWAPAFSYIAATSVAAWVAGLVLRAFYYRESRPFLTA